MVSRAGKRLPSQHRGRIGRRLVVTFVVFVFLVVGSTGWILYRLTRNSLERQMSDQLLAIAQLSAAGIDGDAVRHLRSGFEGGNLHARLRAKLVGYRDLVGARRIYVFDHQGTEPAGHGARRADWEGIYAVAGGPSGIGRRLARAGVAFDFVSGQIGCLLSIRLRACLCRRRSCGSGWRGYWGRICRGDSSISAFCADFWRG